MAEKEYIEREAALNAIKDEIENYQPNPDPYSITPHEFVRRGLNIAYSIIKNQPTADVQEVVRCGFCKHYKLRGGAKWCVLHMVRMHSDDYCSYGAKWIRSEHE